MSYQISAACKQCGICRKVCQAGAIIEQDGQYVIDQDKCESCGACAAECPNGAIVFSGQTASYKPGYAPARPQPCGRRRGRHFHHGGHRRHRCR